MWKELRCQQKTCTFVCGKLSGLPITYSHTALVSIKWLVNSKQEDGNLFALVLPGVLVSNRCSESDLQAIQVRKQCFRRRRDNFGQTAWEALRRLLISNDTGQLCFSHPGWIRYRLFWISQVPLVLTRANLTVVWLDLPPTVTLSLQLASALSPETVGEQLKLIRVPRGMLFTNV